MENVEQLVRTLQHMDKSDMACEYGSAHAGMLIGSA